MTRPCPSECGACCGAGGCAGADKGVGIDASAAAAGTTNAVGAPVSAAAASRQTGGCCAKTKHDAASSPVQCCKKSESSEPQICTAGAVVQIKAPVNRPGVLHGIPDEVLHDAALNDAIARGLPAHYRFEVHKTVWHVRRAGARRVALQMPEGLQQYALALADMHRRWAFAEDVVVLADVAYGACCVDDYTAAALGCDFLVHYGHSCLVPVTHTTVPAMYVFVEILVPTSVLCRILFGAAECESSRRDDGDSSAGDVQPGASPSTAQVKADAETGGGLGGSAVAGLDRLGISDTAGGDRTRGANSSVSSTAQHTVASPETVAQSHSSINTQQTVASSETYAHSHSSTDAQQKISTRISRVEHSQICARVSSADARSPFAGRTVALMATVQFLPALHEVAAAARRQGAVRVLVPQIRPLSPGEVLGCTAPRVASLGADALVFVADGRFHLEAAMVANPGLPAYRWDPFVQRLFRESYDHGAMRASRAQAVRDAAAILARPGARVGVVLGTLGRQGHPLVFGELISRLRSRGAAVLPVLMSEVRPSRLADFRSAVALWVQTSCPRLSVDWGHEFGSIVLTPYELHSAVRLADAMGDADASVDTLSWTSGADAYPMDFYAGGDAAHVPGGGPWTPGFHLRPPRRTGAAGATGTGGTAR